MRYFKQGGCDFYEISREDCERFLLAYFHHDFVKHLVRSGLPFRLKTIYFEYYTKSEDGSVPPLGCYGVFKEEV